jgi:hypothetical protein
MKPTRPKPGFRRGVSLVEAMVSIGVLAIVSPLALAALLRAGEGGNASRAETRAPVIVESCMEELEIARKGMSEHLPTLQQGQEFGGTDVICLAFRGDGTLLGKVDAGAYDSGAGKVAGGDAVFLARLYGEADESRIGFPAMLNIGITIEHPAVAPANKRRAMEFHTKLP